MTTNVTINELANLPHHAGQTVLRAEREDITVEVKRGRGEYWVYLFVETEGGGRYTRLAAPRSTPGQARAWKEGRDFNVVMG